MKESETEPLWPFTKGKTPRELLFERKYRKGVLEHFLPFWLQKLSPDNKNNILEFSMSISQKKIALRISNRYFIWKQKNHQNLYYLFCIRSTIGISNIYLTSQRQRGFISYNRTVIRIFDIYLKKDIRETSRGVSKQLNNISEHISLFQHAGFHNNQFFIKLIHTVNLLVLLIQQFQHLVWQFFDNEYATNIYFPAETR